MMLNILFILDLNSEFMDFKLWDQKLLFRGFVLEIQRICCGIILRDFVTIKLERYYLLIFFYHEHCLIFLFYLFIFFFFC